MIDNEQTEQIEELDDIVVDLSEDEGEKPEETSDTESPITEAVKEETDTKEANDQEQTPDDSPEEIIEESEEPETAEDDSKKVFGKRAEKRIKRLVAQKKELEEKLKAAEEERYSLQAKTDQFARASARNELDSINNYIEGLSSREEQALTALKIAKEGGNVEEEIKATDTLATVKAEALVAKQYKARAESRMPSNPSEKKSEEDVPAKPEQGQPIPDRRALDWQKRNKWFGGNETSDRIMSQAAVLIHKELIEDGINPELEPEEYYAELDARLRSEFPDKFKQKGAKKVPTVVGGTRATVGTSKVKLTKTEVEMAQRLGVDLKEYARQKQRQNKAGGQ
ncbi:MAG: hypothetical protein CML36_01720 [Rhodobacteraceae bacterium]|nr:hypothetical protein [Paracoccaceae bacterium]|tara:strand:+ start:21122 stop:22138 length:1017 start_codon:yes stop_codon:yes gene_type:complete